jgi:hypothetical protein
MSKLLAKAIAAGAIVLFWCMTTIGSTIATTLGTTIGATSLGSKPNQRIELRWQIRFSAFKQRLGGEDEHTFLVERRGVVGDRAVFT